MKKVATTIEGEQTIFDLVGLLCRRLPFILHFYESDYATAGQFHDSSHLNVHYHSKVWGHIENVLVFERKALFCPLK